MSAVTARLVRRALASVTLAVGMGMMVVPAASAAPKQKPPSGHGGGYPGETVAPKTNPGGVSKGDEPGRGAGGTEHDEGCPHDTDRAVDDGHGCHHQGTTPGVAPTAKPTPSANRDQAPAGTGASASPAATTSAGPAVARSVAPVTPPAPVVEGVSAVRTLGDTAPSTAAPTGTLGSAVKVGAVTAASTAPASGLAFTGTDAVAAAGAGLVLLLTGAGFVLLGRRRAGRTA